MTTAEVSFTTAVADPVCWDAILVLESYFYISPPRGGVYEIDREVGNAGFTNGFLAFFIFPPPQR